jgi:hypothetical protein
MSEPPGRRSAPGVGTTEGASENHLAATTQFDVSSVPQTADIVRTRRSCVWCDAPTDTLAICKRCATDLRFGNARRRDAGLRMPPLASGRRDPLGAPTDAPALVGGAS